MALDRNQIAQRISKEVKNGYYVNLGIGIPTLVANFIGDDKKDVVLQSENGLLGMGPFPTKDNVDADLINAGKQTISTVPGSVFFSSAESFAMIRGGHVNLTVLGAMQVDITGSIANWMIPGKMVKGMGGAMDLVAGAQNVIVAMKHTDKKGNSKLLTKCNLPLTGVNCINKVVTDMGVLNIKDSQFEIIEVAPGLNPEDVLAATEGQCVIHSDCTEMTFN